VADRPLQQSLTCENYTTGASYSIAYSEERSDPELVEQFSPEGSGCTRTFLVAWADRFNFIENMVGFAKINAAGTNGVSADGYGTPGTTTYDGRHVHRKLPVGYHMGLVDGSTPPVPIDWVHAVRAVAMPDGAKSNDGAPSLSVNRPKGTYAKILVSFAALDYDLYSDAEVYNGGGSAGSGTIGCCREWLRYARIVQKPASIFFQYPSEALKIVGYPTTGQEGGPLGTVQYEQKPSVLDNIADFWLYIYDLPYDPIAAINLCFGRVNSNAIFPTPDYTAGQPKETLHFVSADIVRQPLRMGRRYWNVQYGFRKVHNIDNSPTGAGAVVGHNYVRKTVKDAAGVTRLRLYRTSADGTTSVVAGNPLIDLVDFRKLFWIPPECIQPPALPAGP